MVLFLFWIAGLRNGVSDEELAEISLAISNYEAQLNDPKEKAEMDAMKVSGIVTRTYIMFKSVLYGSLTFSKIFKI